MSKTASTHRHALHRTGVRALVPQLCSIRSAHRFAAVLVATIALVGSIQARGTHPSSASRPAHPAVAPAAETHVWHRLPDGPAIAGHAAIVHRHAEGARLVTVGGLSGIGGEGAGPRALVLAEGQGRWRPFTTTLAPRSSTGGAVRTGARLAVDPAERTAILRCDCADSGAHLLDLERGEWRPFPGEAQPPLLGGLLAYDAARDRAVHAGGDLLGLGSLVSDTVAHDLSDARGGSSALPTVPFQRVHHAADVDPATGHWLAFGGQEADGEASTELWRADLAQVDEVGAWTHLGSAAESGKGPTPRTGATLTFLGESGMALLFGGYDAEVGERADSWLLDYRDPAAPAWVELAARPDPELGSPEPRAGHVAAWDPVAGSLVLHGGIVVEGRDVRILGDAWLLLPFEEEDAAPAIYLPSLRRP
jgi:hypothetical protein